VRHGDPLSPTLFILCLECVAILLRESTHYTGLKLGSCAVKVSMFADNTLIFLNGEEGQFQIVFNYFKEFGFALGLKINLEKSKVLHVGDSKFSNCFPMLNKGLQWPTDSTQYLDLTIPTKSCNTKFELFQLNFYGYCEKLASKLNLWKSRGLYWRK